MSITQLTAAIAAALALGTAFGQAYPNKPIRLIIPFAPGGSTDIIGRIMSAKLSPILGQPVVVDNKAGAGGSIGAAEIAKAVPDGYTIGMGSVSTMGTNIVAYKNNKLDPVTQFTHITNLASVPGIIVVNKNFPYKDYKSFVAALKASPGKYSYASSGAGGVGHLAMELFLVETGTDAQHIAYKGAGPAVTDVLAGNVPIMWDNLSSSLPQIKAGNFIPIGLAFPKRIPQLPNVPTFKEVGLEPVNRMAYYGIYGPKGLPKEVVDKVNAGVKKALEDPAVKKRIEDTGSLIVANTPEQFAQQIKDELAVYKEVVTKQKLTLQ